MDGLAFFPRRRAPRAGRSQRQPGDMATERESGSSRGNTRTALVLLSIVVVFFIGVIARRYLIG